MPMHPLLESEGGLVILEDLAEAETLDEWNAALSRLTALLLIIAAGGHVDDPADLAWMDRLRAGIAAGWKPKIGRPKRLTQAKNDAAAILSCGLTVRADAVSYLSRRDSISPDAANKRVAAAEARGGIKLVRGGPFRHSWPK